MATPCSVKARGKAEECFSLLNRSRFVTSSSFSFFVSRKNGIGDKSLFLTFLQASLALADSVTGGQTDGKMNTGGMFN